MKLLWVKTEYECNPIGIDKSNPRFSWMFGEGERGLQRSCRILVSTEKGKEGDMWDSGELATDCMTGIRYEGAPLVSWTGYRVKVIVTDDSGKTESCEGKFDTGALSKEDLKAKWISIPCNFHGRTLLIRKVLEIPELPIRRARILVCGLGCYEFFCNGESVSEHTLGPAVTNYSERVLYDVYDLTPRLRPGKNAIGFELGYGWYGARKLWAQIHVVFEDGSVWEDSTMNCGGWWCGAGAVLENSLYGGETYDARQELTGWNTLDFVSDWEHHWMYVFLVDPPAGKLERSSIEDIRVTDSFPAISSKTIAPGYFGYDIGQNISGVVRIRVRGERGARVVLKYGEQALEDGRVNQINLRSAGNCDTYILKGEGEETYEPRFTYHGFQFVEAKIEGNAEILEVTGRRMRNDIRVCGTFSCSDELINRLHRIAVVTEGNNQQGVLTDCPQRDERLGWLNDLAARIYQTNCNYSMERFYPKFIRDITETMDSFGGIADTAPFFTGGRPADPVSVCYLLFPLSCMRLYGDSETPEREYDSIRRWVEFLLTRQNGFIMDYSYYGDWVSPAATKQGEIPENEKTNGQFVSTVYLFWHLKCMAELAKRLNRGEDFTRYSDLAEQSRAVIQKTYYHTEEKYYLTDSQSANAIALSLGLVPEEDREDVARRIVADIQAHNWHLTCGNQGYRHLFYALTDVLGDEGAEILLRVLRNPEYPGWGYMIANGATTVWERWEYEMKNEMNSFDHPMFGSYDAWFYEYLAGIRVDEKAFGCDNFLIHPVFPASISQVSASRDTLRGKISCEWERKAESVLFKLNVPANACAKLDIAGLRSVNGNAVQGQPSLGPGCYEIVVNRV